MKKFHSNKQEGRHMKNLELTVFSKLDDKTIAIDKTMLDDDMLGGQIHETAQMLFQEHCHFDYTVTDENGKDVTDMLEW